MSKAKITTDSIQAAFYMEPEDIVNYFKDKGLKISNNWHEAYTEAHSKAFTVAKMTELDLLRDTQNLLIKSIKDGTAYQAFKRDAKKLFAEKGWVGKKEVINPKTGEKETVELGTPRRIKTIYTNNINSAYSVGRYREMLEEVDVAPYWQYMTMADGRERPEHGALHGKVYRADDPFWAAFMPPNGWGCRCWVRNLTASMVKKIGAKVESSEGRISYKQELVGDKKVNIPVYKFENAGQIRSVKPDAGWEYNPGSLAWGIDVQAWNKVEGLPEEVKYDFISRMAVNPYKKEVIKNIINDTLKRPDFSSRGIETAIGWFNPQIISNLNKESIKMQTPVIVFEDRQVKHSLGERKAQKQRLTEEQFKKVYDYINSPDEIYIDTQDYAVIYIKYLPKSEIINNCDCIKVPVKINSSNSKRPVNYIGTTSRINSNTIKKDKRYKKLE